MWRYITLGVVIIVGGALIYLSARGNLSPLPSGPRSLELVNLPSSYCAKTAKIAAFYGAVKNKVYSAGNVFFDEEVSINNCKTISLEPIAPKGNYYLYVKLPKAAAFRMWIRSDFPPTLSYSPPVGDVTGDDVIDSGDKDFVSSRLGSSNSSDITAADLDGDGAVTIMDLSLVNMHQQVGAERPDGKEWGVD